MSEAISGIELNFGPGFRFAHPGYVPVIERGELKTDAAVEWQRVA
jgi:hypothetical protein